MTQHIMEEQDRKVQDTAKRIADTLQAAFDILIERRETAYADAIVPLNAERESLAREYTAIDEAAHNLKDILPAKRREAQRAADALLLEGKREEAEAKVAEAQQAADAPAAMNERQREISARIEEIESEKRSIARTIFEKWLTEEVQPVVRAGEHALFITLLDGLENSLYTYQESTGTGTSGNRQRPLIHQGTIAGLTADERSPEWQAGTRWYGGRR